MRRSGVLVALALAALAAAALVLRTVRLEQRVMHGDEANQAVKAGELWETGEYRYDPVEHHGPSLYWFTLPALALRGAGSFSSTAEFDYRVVPAVFGAVLVLLLLLAADGLGRGPAVLAAVLTVVSPAMVYYARYYVQETLLVFFTFLAIAAAWRFCRSGSVAWAAAAGAAVGMMHATKETWILAGAAMGAGLGLALLWTRVREGQWPAIAPVVRPAPVAAALVAAAAVVVAFYSSFGADWEGPWNSIAAYQVYIRRGSDPGIHVHPWHYYLELLAAFRPAKGFFWSEGLIVGLAGVGAIAALAAGRPAPLEDPQAEAAARAGRVFRRFLAFYTIALTAAYSAVPYKTPWCLLSFLHGMILLAGVGAWTLLAPLSRRTPLESGDESPRSKAAKPPPAPLSRPTGEGPGVRGIAPEAGEGAGAASEPLESGDESPHSKAAKPLLWAWRAVVLAALAAGVGHLTWQCWWLNFRIPADARNPYVYAHTSSDALNLAAQMERLAAAAPEGRAMVVHVVTPENYWPLPWYLRRFDHVGYWQDAAAWKAETAAAPAPAVVFCTAGVQDDVAAALPGPHRTMMYGLRPGVLLTAYVRPDVWAAFVARSSPR